MIRHCRTIIFMISWSPFVGHHFGWRFGGPPPPRDSTHFKLQGAKGCHEGWVVVAAKAFQAERTRKTSSSQGPTGIVPSQPQQLIMGVTDFLKRTICKTQDGVTRVVHGKEEVSTQDSFYDLTDTDIQQREISMSQFEGKVLLVLNVASKWVLTKPNYAHLPKIIAEYGSRGFEVLAFPSNQFLGQDGNVSVRTGSSIRLIFFAICLPLNSLNGTYNTYVVYGTHRITAREI